MKLWAVVSALAMSACMFHDARQQQARIAHVVCTFEGTVVSQRASARPLVVVLLARPEDAATRHEWRLVDHFVSANEGRWKFFTKAGTYSLSAFEDVNSDLRFQPGEPFIGIGMRQEFRCAGGERQASFTVVIPSAAPDAPTPASLASLHARSADEQLVRTLGEASAVGELVTLDDPRFALADASDGLWRPLDHMVKSPPGVYFLEAYDPRKTPVLFVHGINGSPAQFAPLIDKLDRTRFQPWLYNYPSGAYLSNVADHLDQVMTKLAVGHGVRRIIVVAHSMGGLVSRGFLLRHVRSPGKVEVPLFVSISTPWGGHAAAKSGVEHAPVVVHVWKDMAPGSEYLTSLFAQSLPESTRHHLLFTFRQGGISTGEADDGVVTLATQLEPKAQSAAYERFGFNETHTSVLESAELSELLDRLLEHSLQ